MGLEVASYIKDLVSTNPLSSDLVAQGDDHLRLLKSVLLGTFPNMGGNLGDVTEVGAGATVTDGDNTRVYRIPTPSAGTITHTFSLPAAASVTSGFYIDVVVPTTGDFAIITPTGGASIEGAATLTLGPGTLGRVYFDGTTWRVNQTLIGTDGGAPNRLPVRTSTTALEVRSTLTVSGAAVLQSTALVSGILTAGGGVFNGALQANTTFSVSGASVLHGAVTANSTMSVSGAATFKGAVSISGALGTAGALSVGGSAVVTGNMTVAGVMTVSSAMVLTTTLTVGGAATFGATISVSGAATFNGVSIFGAATLASTLSVSGATVLHGGVTANSTLTVSGAATFKGAASIVGSVHIGGTLTVSGAAYVGGTLTVSGAAVLLSSLNVGAGLTVGGGMTVSGTAYLQGTAHVGVLSVSGAATFDSSVSVSASVVTALGYYGPNACTAWFRGGVVATVPTISAAFNISSITDNGVGEFALNFTATMSSGAYAVVTQKKQADDAGNEAGTSYAFGFTTIAFGFKSSTGSSANEDSAVLAAVVFGGK